MLVGRPLPTAIVLSALAEVHATCGSVERRHEPVAELLLRHLNRRALVYMWDWRDDHACWLSRCNRRKQTRWSARAPNGDGGGVRSDPKIPDSSGDRSVIQDGGVRECIHTDARGSMFVVRTRAVSAPYTLIPCLQSLCRPNLDDGFTVLLQDAAATSAAAARDYRISAHPCSCEAKGQRASILVG